MTIEIEKTLFANISLDIFGIILTVFPIVYLLSGNRYKDRSNRYFLLASVSNILMIIGDLGDWVFRDITDSWMKITLLALTALYYSCTAFVPYFFSRYIIEYLKVSGGKKKIYVMITTGLCSLQIIFAVISPFTGAIFYVTDAGYHRGPLFFVSQLVALSCYLLFTYIVISNRGKMNHREVVFFLLCILVPLAANTVQMIVRGLALMNIGIALSLLFIFVNIQLEYEITLFKCEQELLHQKSALDEQRIQLLLSQIQPHFLFNSLGTIAELCRIDPKAAEKATEEFAGFLRGNMMSLKAKGLIPFGQELEHVKNYLYLEHRRFQERLNVDYNIEVTDFLIPPLSLQPLAENAVRHGICHRKEGGNLTISTREIDGFNEISIKDDGIGIEKSKEYPNLGGHAHIGISNVRKRIETMTGGYMDIESSDGGTTVRILIPFNRGGK